MGWHDHRGHNSSTKKQTYTADEVSEMVKQAWWSGFNNSGEGNNAEHCQTSISDLKSKCDTDTLKLLEGTLKDQLPS